MDQSGDNEIANIYERVLKGDKSGLKNLQNIKNSPSKKPQKMAQNPTLRSSKDQQISQDLSKASRSENFRKYLGEKVSEFGTGNISSKKQISRTQKQPQRKVFAESKPFSKVRKRSDVKSEQKNMQELRPEEVVKEIVPPHKTKTASNNFQSNMNKNVIKDSVTQKDKNSTPPTSKHSFRIRTQGGNKKLLEQLMRLNEEQKRMQSQILHFHKEHKEAISQICQKFKINLFDISYAKNHEAPAEELLQAIDSPGKSFLKLHPGHISNEEEKIVRLSKEIAILHRQIQTKKNQITKKQAKIEVLPLYALLVNTVPDIFEERESEEEGEEVGELPASDSKNVDPNKTYQSVMIQMRKKKWGLNQRISYQSEITKSSENRQDPLKLPPKGLAFSPAKVEGGDDSKIVVNSRLKQFLFQ